ncbi:hypothetical protein NPIL_339691 [Nephila pilipes]|uniref:Uncharacterized protein n=1 Tax=Nephila pilipes TaxID=299642 RepID=A0A8X6U9U8_NEPPI|nr:hypothetical protein NPIL_339691 [Nephila pilipes]
MFSFLALKFQLPFRKYFRLYNSCFPSKNCRSLPIRRDFPNYWFRRLPAGVTTMMDRGVINGRALERNTNSAIGRSFPAPRRCLWILCHERRLRAPSMGVSC